MASELVVGTVVRVDEHPGARAPSLLLTVDLGIYDVEGPVDLGPRGTHEAVLPSGAYEAAQLEDTQLVCRLEDGGAIVAGAESHARGFVLLRPDGEVEPGTIVG